MRITTGLLRNEIVILPKSDRLLGVSMWDRNCGAWSSEFRRTAQRSTGRQGFPPRSDSGQGGVLVAYDGYDVLIARSQNDEFACHYA